MPSLPATWLEDFVVNLNPNGLQWDPVITQLASGHFLVVWTDSDSSSVPGSPAGNDVIGRVFDAMGNAVTGEIRLNSRNSSDNELNPTVTALANGGFVIAYDESGTYDDLNIETYSFNPTTAAVTFVHGEYLFNDPTTTSDANPVDPVVASASATSVMAAYHTVNTDGSDDIIIRTYNPTTNVIGAEINIFDGATGIGEDVSGPDITALSNGNYAITYVNQNNAPATDSWMVEIRNQAGGLLNSATVFSYTDVNDPQIVALKSGHFVVASSITFGNGDVIFRVYDNSGVPLTNGGPFNAGNGPNSQNDPALVALADGSFIVARDDDTTGQIIGERWIVSGQDVLIVSGFVIDDTGGTGITDIEMQAFEDGRFAVTWNDGSDIRVKILDTRDFVNATGVYMPDQWQVGTVGDDVFTADFDSEFVAAYDGNDTVTESGQVRTYLMGNGNDTLNVVSPINADVHDGGAGTDTIDWSGTLGSVVGATFNLAAGTATDGGLFTETMIGFENLTGTNNSDNISGTAGSNILIGLAGNDTIDGISGADSMFGGDGNDIYGVRDVTDIVDETGSSGTDTVNATVTVSLSDAVHFKGAIENFVPSPKWLHLATNDNRKSPNLSMAC